MKQHRRPDADGIARDRGDHRLGKSGERLDEAQRRKFLAQQRPLEKVLEVVARGEGPAGAGEQNRAQAESASASRRAAMSGEKHLAVERVVLVRAVEDNSLDSAVALDYDFGVHERLPGRRFRAHPARARLPASNGLAPDAPICARGAAFCVSMRENARQDSSRQVGPDVRLATAKRPARRRDAGVRLLDLVYPPSCLCCREAVAANGGLCANCWNDMGLIERPYCERLGTPFEREFEAPGMNSPEAAAHPPMFARARAVARYDGGTARGAG